MSKAERLMNMIKEQSISSLGKLPSKPLALITTSNGKKKHKHKYSIDQFGMGETDNVEGHKHDIIAFELQPMGIDGHSHKIDLPESQMTYDEWAKENPTEHAMNEIEESN